ncbi:10137_t:CDS:2, partial [Funneliformis geosporum]
GSQWWDQKTSDAPSAGNTCQGVASHHHSDQKTSDNPSAAGNVWSTHRQGLSVRPNAVVFLQ